MQKFTKRAKKGKKGAKNADFSRTDKSTAKPMVVGCVQHYSTYFIKKIGKSLEPLFHKVQKIAKKGNNGGKRAKKGAENADFRLFLPFFNFWSIFVNFEPKKKFKISNKNCFQI